MSQRRRGWLRSWKPSIFADLPVDQMGGIIGDLPAQPDMDVYGGHSLLEAVMDQCQVEWPA